MNNNKQSITSSQLMILILATQIGVGIIYMPSTLAKEVGNEGWISVLIAGIIGVVSSIPILFLLKRYRDKSIYDITKLLFGKYIGLFFNALIGLYFFLMSTSILRMITVFIKLTLLSRTNVTLLAILLLLPVVYLVWYGLKPICRFSSIVPIILIIVIVYILQIRNELQLSFLLPLGKAKISEIFRGALLTSFSYLGLELIIVIFPYIVNKGNILKLYTSASIITMIFYMIIVIAITALFGEKVLKRLTIPLFSMVRIYNSPILERVDLYYISLWFIPIICTLIGYIYAGYYSLNIILNLKKSKLTLVAYLVAVFIISRLPNNINDVLRYSTLTSYYGAGIVIFAILCFIISLFTIRGVKNNEV